MSCCLSPACVSARALRSSKSNIVEVILPNLQNPFFSKLADLCAGKDCSLVTVRATHYKEYTYPRDLYGKPVMHVFEDTDIPLPEKWEDILTGLYGDFMVPPPEDKRSGATGFPCSLYKDYLEDQKRS